MGEKKETPSTRSGKTSHGYDYYYTLDAEEELRWNQISYHDLDNFNQ